MLKDNQLEVLLHEKFQYVFEADLLKEILKYGTFREIEPDKTLMDIGDSISQMPLLISGSIKIIREDKSGNELLLYYLEVGDTCAMTINCTMGKKKSEIRAVTEELTKLIFIPVHKMDEWLVKFQTWRTFILDSYNTRLMEAIDAIDNLAFHNMEQRIYKYLWDKALVTGTQVLRLTHAQIANDLNSSRVVISRLMKKLEKDGKIKYDRNQIEVKKAEI